MPSLKENKILALAIPATIENILQTTVGFIDALMISKIGLVAVSAVGIANTVLNVYLALFIALGVGASALIAQKIGAKKSDEAQTVTNQSVLLTVAISVLLGMLSIFFACDGSIGSCFARVAAVFHCCRRWRDIHGSNDDFWQYFTGNRRYEITYAGQCRG